MKTAKAFYSYIIAQSFNNIRSADTLNYLCTRLEKLLRADEDVMICWSTGTVYEDMNTDSVTIPDCALFAITTSRVLAIGKSKAVSVPIELYNGIYCTVSALDSGDELIMVAKDILLVFDSGRIMTRRLLAEVNTRHRLLMRKICHILGHSADGKTVVITEEK